MIISRNSRRTEDGYQRISLGQRNWLKRQVRNDMVSFGRDKDFEKPLGYLDDTKVTEDTCSQCGTMLPDASYSNLLSFLRFCFKCQYNYPNLLNWGMDKVDASGYGRLLHGYHEVIKTKKPDTDTELKGPDSTFRSGSTFRKKKKRKGNTDWVKSSMDYD